MHKKANFFAIGLFVMIGSVIGALAIVILGSGKLNQQSAAFLVTFRESTNGLLVGSKVKTYGVEVGNVTKVMLHRDPASGEIVIPVLIEIDLGLISSLMGSPETVESPDEIFNSIVASGARAKLQMENLVTGMLYVELELGIGQEGYVLASDRFADYHSLPTVPTQMQMMISTMGRIVENLSETDIKGLVEETKGTVADLRGGLNQVDFAAMEKNLNRLLATMDNLVGNPNLAKAADDLSVAMESLREITAAINQNPGGTLQNLNVALEQMQGTMRGLELVSANANAWFSPSSAVYQEVVDALDQFGDASRSLRVLIEYAERNPNAFITGKSREPANP